MRAESLSMARLVCTDGPLAGQQFLLEEEEVVVGRATENLVSIPDTSVSRRHLGLRKEGNAWLARDLGSGNGTFLNGELLAAETQLADGDLLTLGDTVLRFSDGSSETVLLAHPPPPPARPRGGAVMETIPPRRMTSEVTARPSGRVRPTRSQMPAVTAQAHSRSLLLKLSIAFAAISLLLAVGLVVYKVFTPLVPPEAPGRPVAVEVPRTQVLLEESTRLLREQKWELALKSLEELRQLQPEDAQVGKYMEFARKELANEQALEAAHVALRQDQLQEAAEALNKVSSDTTLYPRLEELREDLARRAEWRVKKARDLLELDRPTPARAEVEKVLAALPRHEEALQVKELVLQVLKRRLAPKPAPTPVPAPAPPRRERQQKEPRRQPWELALEHYVAGELPKALEQLAACQQEARCKSLGAQVEEARDLFARVEALDLQERMGLLELDRHITDYRGSKPGSAVANQVAEELCSKAAGFKAGGNWALALENLQTALWAAPSNERAQAMFNDLLARARGLVEDAARAAAEGKVEEARQMLRQVLVMTSAEQEVHKQAKARLEELSE